jgi:Txe/YoeB family toxin of toxin-antitoxin system
MVSWHLVFTKQAQKDARKLAHSGLKPQASRILNILRKDPYQNPPSYEKLVGDLRGAYLRRINIQHRLVYQILDDIKTVNVIRRWTHYK